MIDPLEVMIAYVKNELSHLVGDRVAAKHRFGDAWKIGEMALAIGLDGGPPDLYAPISRPRLEVRFYAADTTAIVGLFGALATLARSTSRVPVAITDAKGLLQSFTRASELSLLYDDDLKIDFGMAFFDAIVSEEAVIE